MNIRNVRQVGFAVLLLLLSACVSTSSKRATLSVAEVEEQLARMDSDLVPFAFYFAPVLRAIEEQWHLNINSKSRTEGEEILPEGSSVTVRFILRASGDVEVLEVSDGAGKKWAMAAVNAIAAQHPFPEWPEAMVAAFGNSRELEFTFHY